MHIIYSAITNFYSIFDKYLELCTCFKKMFINQIEKLFSLFGFIALLKYVHGVVAKPFSVSNFLDFLFEIYFIENKCNPYF